LPQPSSSPPKDPEGNIQIDIAGLPDVGVGDADVVEEQRDEDEPFPF
jgi:hypothetical protein